LGGSTTTFVKVELATLAPILAALAAFGSRIETRAAILAGAVSYFNLWSLKT